MDPPSPSGVTYNEILENTLQRVSSASTVPTNFGHSIYEDMKSIKTDHSCPVSLNQIPCRDRPRFGFATPGKYQQEIVLPIKYVQHHPTVTTEVNWFYRFVSAMKRLKIFLFDNTVDFFDCVYARFWALYVVQLFISFYQRNKDKKYIGFLLQTLKCVLNTRTVILLPLFPIGLVFYSKNYDIAVVICLVFALMYFAKLLSNTTVALEAHVGPLFSSLLNATFGNLVELVIAGTTVAKEDATLTITSIIGAVLSNNLLVVGSCFLFGGLDGEEIGSIRTISNHMFFVMGVTMLLTLMSVISLIDNDKSIKFKMDTSQIGASFILLCYLVYLIVCTNQEFKMIKSKREKILVDQEYQSIDTESVDSSSNEAPPPMIVCLMTLAVATAGLGPCANFFVKSLKALTDDKPISKVFIGLVILPLAGSLPEHFSSLVAAHKDQMDLAVSLSIGSSNQVLGMVLPIIQFISSLYPETGFTLYIEPYAAGYLFASTFVLVGCLGHALIFRVNVLHATMLLTCYGFIIYLTFAN